MDDHDLGALLDASVPAAAASDEALSRIHRRAGQRRRRTALAGSALAVAVGVMVAFGLSAISASDRGSGRVPPAGESSNPGGTTTIVPDGRCFAGDVILRIGEVIAPQAEAPVQYWAVVATSTADAPCRLVNAITATIRDADGRIVQGLPGVASARVLPTDPSYVQQLDPDSARVIAYIDWLHPCGDGKVELEATGVSAHAARIGLDLQPCASTGGSARFLLTGAVAVAGQPCPPGSLTLTIDPAAIREGPAIRWPVTVTTSTKLPCRIYEGLTATIEADGTVFDAIAGNPARQGERFFGLIPPGTAQFAGYLRWTNPCSDGPVALVVAFLDDTLATPARLNLPKQTCAGGPIGTSSFAIDTGVPAVTRSAGSPTTAARTP